MLKRQSCLRKPIIKKLPECFVADVSATRAGKFSKVNRNTANLWYRTFKEKILVYQETILGQMSGEVELDESYFGGPRGYRGSHARRFRR